MLFSDKITSTKPCKGNQLDAFRCVVRLCLRFITVSHCHVSFGSPRTKSLWSYCRVVMKAGTQQCQLCFVFRCLGGAVNVSSGFPIVAAAFPLPPGALEIASGGRFRAFLIEVTLKTAATNEVGEQLVMTTSALVLETSRLYNS